MRQTTGIQANISVVDILVTAYLLFGVVNAFAVVHGHYNPLPPWEWVVMGAIYALLRIFATQAPARNFVLCTITLVGAVQAAIAVLQSTGWAESNHRMFDVTGSFGNPGQLGGFLAVASALMLAIVFGSANRWERWFSVAASLLIVTGLWLADSRAALVALVAGVLVYFCGSIGRWLRRRWAVALPVTIVVLVIASATLYRYRPASADARLLIWRVSADMVVDKPLFG